MKRIFILLLSPLFLLFASCSKNKENETPPTNSYPKTVSVEYRVSSTSLAVAGSLSYTNETGGTASFSNVSLSYSKSLTVI